MLPGRKWLHRAMMSAVMEGAYELAVQHGQAGYYAVVRLEVKFVSFF